jgi:hypothetical protein
MSGSLDTSFFDIPAGAIISAVATDAPDTRSQLVAQLRDRIEEVRGEQNEWSRRFDKLYDEARTSDWNAPFLMQWAAALLEKQRAALELFHPIIKEFQHRAADYAACPDAELLELCLATIALVLGWITPYQTLCGALLELAAKRQSTVVVLRARPAAGETNYAELSREHMAIYPKIRAALAE